MSNMGLDDYDKEILKSMQEDASISNIDLSKKIGLAPSSCLLRTKNLKENKIILQSTIIVDERKLGFEITAFARVEVSPLNRETSARFIKEVSKLDKVIECYTISGNGSFLIKIIAKNINDYRNFIIDQIMGIPFVSNVESTLVMGVEKKTNLIPLD